MTIPDKYRYSGKKKIYMLGIVTLLSCIAFTILSVISYFIVRVIVGDEETDSLPLDEGFIENFSKAAVASNGHLCAEIGKNILRENGTAVDAAIGVAICEGVLCFQSMGIGGGFIMTIYNKRSGVVEVLNARETAPLLATENMYKGNATLSEKGGLAVGVPGELKGYYAAYKKYGGGVPWRSLFQPTIKICKEGFKIQTYLASHIQRYKNDIMANPTLRDILLNPNTGKLLVEGDILKRPKLGKFLEVIANEGITPFYEGKIADNLVAEIKAAGGIVTKEDFKNYQVQWMKPVQIQWGKYKMYTSPVPGSGELLAFILNILKGFDLASNETVMTQRFVETFKWGYGRRTELGDISKDSFVPNATHIRELISNLTSEKYADEIRLKIKDDKTSQDPKFYGAKVSTPDDHGTCHISVMSADGDAVALTSTVNLVFGAKFTSKSTGILFNNEMCDFSAPNINSPFGIPPSPANFIRPGKRPLSSMCPTIFLNENNEVTLVTGASGGTRITTTVAFVALNNLLKNKTIKQAIDLPRIHHQLFPMEADYETGFSEASVKRLIEIGHKTKETAVTRTSTVTAVGKINGVVSGSFDYRRGGSFAGY